jgi:GT2 family glycosyltransferase
VVSTIIPVRNRAVLLADAVNSVLSQGYRPLEIIIIDDGSTDGTAEAGRALAALHPAEITFITCEHQGIGGARNTGLDLASGEFVQFLDSDDVLMADKFALQVAGLRANPDCGISYCHAREYGLGRQWSGLPSRRTGSEILHLFPDILRGRVWPTPAPLYRRSVVDAIGPFTALTIYEDWEYECRAAATGTRLHHCKAFLADKRDTHHLEGRRKGGVPAAKIRDYAEAHARICAHALAAGVGAAGRDRFAGRLFAVARRCAAHGFEPEARRCLDLSTTCAVDPTHRRRVARYEAVSIRLGWQRVGVWCERATATMGAVRRARRWPSAVRDRWQHRLRVARATVAGEPMFSWPQLLAERWSNRRSRHGMGL